MELVGTLVEAPNLRYTSTGKEMATFPLFIDGEVKKVICWEELAGKVADALEARDKVRLFGSSKLRWWTELNGEKKSEEQFTAYRVQLLKRHTNEEASQYCCRLCSQMNSCSKVCYDSYNEIPETRICAIDGDCVSEDDNEKCFVGKEE